MVTSLEEGRCSPSGGVRKEVADLFRGEWIGDADQPQALRKPRKRNDRPVETLRGLMTAAHGRLWAAVDVETRHLEGCDRNRQLLHADVVDPCKRRSGRT